MEIRPLHRSDLTLAISLLTLSIPDDAIARVAEEKLFGQNASRVGETWGAWQANQLVGLLALAGRWIKLLAVLPETRQHGIGTELVKFAQSRASGKGPLRLFDHPGNYFTPGISETWLGAHEFARKCNFHRLGIAENLRVPLDFPTQRLFEAGQSAKEKGYDLHRTVTTENSKLLSWIEKAFSPSWSFETQLALYGPRRAVHAAWQNGRPVAFACADGNNRGLGWYGPAGTDPAHRGKGLGEALLLLCLTDVADLPQAGVIAWAGSKPFYEKVLDAKVEGRFVLYEERP